jgi:hypothetical protein
MMLEKSCSCVYEKRSWDPTYPTSKIAHMFKVCFESFQVFKFFVSGGGSGKGKKRRGKGKKRGKKRKKKMDFAPPSKHPTPKLDSPPCSP